MKHKFDVIVNGVCLLCGKDLEKERVFLCEDCQKKENNANRLERVIENHRMRAIMCKIVGDFSEAQDELYLYDCLSTLKNIQDCGDCNVCASKKDCQYTPELGQMVRYNCPFYKKVGDKE